MTKWVRANDDKPHRCPECHRIADELREGWTLRDTGHCPDCGVRWSLAEAAATLKLWQLRRVLRRH